jgi:hypothetical protein
MDAIWDEKKFPAVDHCRLLKEPRYWSAQVSYTQPTVCSMIGPNDALVSWAACSVMADTNV